MKKINYKNKCKKSLNKCQVMINEVLYFLSQQSFSVDEDVHYFKIRLNEVLIMQESLKVFNQLAEKAQQDLLQVANHLESNLKQLISKMKEI